MKRRISCIHAKTVFDIPLFIDILTFIGSCMLPKKLMEEWDSASIRLVSTGHTVGELLVSSHDVVPIRSLFSERRHVRDLLQLCDEAVTVFLRLDGDVHAAVSKVVTAFVEKGLIEDEGILWSDLLMQNDRKPRRLVECRDTKQNALLPATVIFCDNDRIEKRMIGVVSLQDSGSIVVVVAAPPAQKPTKSAKELALTLASFLEHSEVRHDVSQARSFSEFRSVVESFCSVRLVVVEQRDSSVLHELDVEKTPFVGIWKDWKRRAPWYCQDFIDGFVGPKHLQKMISATVFMFFIILLPSLALGESFSVGTNGIIAIQQVLWMQLVAGCSFALFGGQPLVIIMTTAPFALFTRVLYRISQSLGVSFLPLYAWTGLFCAAYGVLMAIFNLSFLVRYFTLFTEETFALFIATSFLFVSIVACVDFFNLTYHIVTTQASAILYLLLMIFSVWLMVTIRNLNRTSLFAARVREIVSDFGLPIGVVFSSFFGSFVFQSVPLPRFGYSPSGRVFVITNLLDIPTWAIFASMGFGLVLVLLFVIDHSISSAMAQTPSMKTRKGSAYHWDLLLTSLICIVSSLFGMPWVNASVPHGPMHTMALADLEVVNQDGASRLCAVSFVFVFVLVLFLKLAIRFSVTYCRETRVAALFANGLIGLCILALPLPLQYIPVPVLYGVFLFMAVTSLDGNTFWDRLVLFVTQQSRYPAYNYVRRVEQKQIHIYTLIQLFCCVVLCVVAFVPQDYVNLIFPVLLVILLLVRQFLLPIFFSKKNLRYLDAPYT